MLHAAAAATAAAAAGHNPCTLFYGEGLCEAYAVLGRHTDAIAAASLQREQFPFNPFLQLHAQGVAGRSTAALGGDGAAAAAAAALGAAADRAGGVRAAAVAAHALPLLRSGPARERLGALSIFCSSKV